MLWGEGGQYHDMFNGMCGVPFSDNVSNKTGNINGSTFCLTQIATGKFNKDGTPVQEGAFITGSEVNRWGLGVMQEINSAAMHVWFNWQHLELNLDATGSGCTVTGESRSEGGTCYETGGTNFGKHLKASYEDLDIFMLGGVIFF